MAASAFNNSGGIAAVARAHEVSLNACKAHVMQLAEFAMASQSKLLEALTRHMQQGRPPLLYAACLQMYDETGQKIVASAAGVKKTSVYTRTSRKRKSAELAALADASREPRLPLALGNGGKAEGAGTQVFQRSTAVTAATKLEVCVQRMFFQWLEKGDTRPRNLEVFIPPVRIPSTSARWLWSALRGTPQIKPVLAFKRALLDRAAETTGLAVDLEHTDNASGNDLYYAAATQTDNPEWAKSRILCLNRQSHLGMMGLFSGPLQAKFIGPLYAVTAFLRMGAHSLRLMMSIDTFLSRPGVVRVVKGGSTLADKRFIGEMQDYLLLHAGHGSARGAPAALAFSLKELFAVWNTGFSGPSICHACAGATCCPEGIQSTRLRLRNALITSVFSKTPTTPQVGKWTQLGLCIDWFFLALTNNVGPNAFSSAFQKMEAKGGDKEENVLEGFAMDVSWQAVCGRREVNAEASLQDPAWRARVLIVGVLVEPCTLLCNYFAKASHGEACAPRTEKEPTYGLDCVNPKSSLIVACMQYWSSITKDPRSASRLIIVFRSRGVENFAEWERRYPEDVELLRKGAQGLHAAIFSRVHRHVLSELQILTVGDRRVPRSERINLATAYACKNACCLKPGLHRRVVENSRRLASQFTEGAADPALLLASGGRALALDSPAYTIRVAGIIVAQEFPLFCISGFVRLSCANVERMHSCNRVLALSGQSSFATISALSLLHHEKERTRQWQALAVDERAVALQDAAPGAAGRGAGALLRRRIRAASPA